MPADDRLAPGTPLRWGAVAAGTLLFFALLVLLGLVGAAAGGLVFAPEEGGGPGRVGVLAGGVAGALAVVAAFAAGGYTAGRIAQPDTRAGAALHGLLVWALAAVTIGTTAGVGAGLLAFGAVAQTSLSALLGSFAPRIESKVDLSDRRITSRVVPQEEETAPLGSTVERMGDAVSEARKDPEARQAVRASRRALATASGLGFAGLLGGGFAAAGGARRGARAEPSAGRARAGAAPRAAGAPPASRHPEPRGT